VFEAKMRTDSAGAEPRKIKLLAINLSPLTYDFERARATHRTGFATDQISYDLTSDLLPGFSFRSTYSLFQGSLNSDTARFSPYRTEISSSFTINGQSGIGAAIARLFGHPPNTTTRVTPQTSGLDSLAAQQMTSLPVTGSYVRNQQYEIPTTQGWSTSISFSARRQRPPRGGNVLTYDPGTYCTQFIDNPLIYDQCQQNVLLNPQTAVQATDPIAGGVFVRVPPTETIQAQSSFHITEKWSASWSTMYDIVNNKFASHQVTLQRDLHDWRATFSFTSSPNGNFFFSFLIANKAQPELQLPYDKQTIRSQTTR
jgi:hypothetical protein